MIRYFMVSRPGNSVEVSRRDLEEFERWLSRDLAYRRKRSKHYLRNNPGKGDANQVSIQSRMRLHGLVKRVLGRSQTSEQPESNHAVTNYGQRIDTLSRKTK